jgi:hypothetical protein
VRRAPEDSLPTVARPPTRPEIVPVLLQRYALQDGPPCSGPVSLADGSFLKQGEPPDADFQGCDVGRFTHDRAPDDVGLTCCSCALSLPLCSSGGRCGRDGREGRHPFSPHPSATRQRCRAGGPPQRPCMWCACPPLPCHHGKPYLFVWVPEKKRKTIPVLTLRMHRANRLDSYVRFETGTK